MGSALASPPADGSPNAVGRFHVHFTPAAASWISLVERWFATLTEKQIRRGTHRSTRALEDAIREYLRIYRMNPKPLVWTKTADEILARVERFLPANF